MPPAQPQPQRVAVNHYHQGRRLEYKVIAALREAGFVVMRAASSKGAVDVMAVRPGELLFVQVKRRTPPGPGAWNLLFDMAAWCGAAPLLATCEPYKPIRYERMMLRKPIKRCKTTRDGALTGCIPYRLEPTAVLEESAAEDDSMTEGDPQW